MLTDDDKRVLAERRVAGLRASINFKCKDCIYDPESGLGNWRQQVGACEAYDCPLWPVRPRSKPHGGKPMR